MSLLRRPVGSSVVSLLDEQLGVLGESSNTPGLWGSMFALSFGQFPRLHQSVSASPVASL